MQDHSALIRNLIKLKGTAKLTAQGERVCLKDSKYLLSKILENRTCKSRTSSCRPSKPNCQIGLAWPAGACTALPCPMWQDFKQNIFGILEAYPFTLCSQFCCTFQFYQSPDQRTVTPFQLPLLAHPFGSPFWPPSDSPCGFQYAFP